MEQNNQILMEWVHPRNDDGNNLLFEYYARVSRPQDSDLLGNLEIWVYGNDREAFPPHCHVRSKNGKFEFEVSLLNWEVINIKNSKLPNSWDSIDRNIKKSFFEWLDRKPVESNDPTNKISLFYSWNNENSENPLSKWIDKKENIDTELLQYLNFEQKIDISKLISSIFQILLPIYKNKEDKEKLHKLAVFNPIDFAKEIGLPFEFNELTATKKVISIIQEHEKMCYELSKDD